jgi:hypothetical protein
MRSLTRDHFFLLADCTGPCDADVAMQEGSFDIEDGWENLPANAEELVDDLVERGLVLRFRCEACSQIDGEEPVDHANLTLRGQTALAFYRAHLEVMIEKKA